MLRDLARALRTPRALFAGAFSALVGLVFVAAATVLLLPAVDDAGSDFVPVSIFTFLTALGIELLVGNDLRGAIGRIAAGRLNRNEKV